MGSATAIFSTAYTFVDGKLDVFLNERAATIMAQVQGPMQLALVLYVILYGIAITRGAIAEPLMDFVVRGVKLAIIYALATTVAYNTYVAALLNQALPNSLARAISGASVADVGGSFDQYFAYGAALSEKIVKSAAAVDIPAFIIAGTVFVVTAAASAFGFAIVLVAKVALALIVALGPVFVACSLFESTRRFFIGWLSQAVNYIILFALIITVFQLVLSLTRSEWTQIDGDPNVKVAGMVFSALSLLSAVFFLHVPALASGIAGGASTGIADFFSAIAIARRAGGNARRSTPRFGSPGSAPRGGSVKPLGAH